MSTNHSLVELMGSSTPRTCSVRAEDAFLERLCKNPIIGRLFLEVACYYTFGLEAAESLLRNILLDFYSLCSSMGDAVVKEVPASSKSRALIVSLRGCKLGSIESSNNRRRVRIDCQDRVYVYEMVLE